jgi:hypothetical protein
MTSSLYDASNESAGWFRKQYLDGKLELRPPFQRKPVWAARNKCALIETLLLDLPVPEIYVQTFTAPDGDVRYAVVDGQQRVRTLLQFAGVEKEAEELKWNKFSLDKLSESSEFHDQTFDDLTDDQKKGLWLYKFAVRHLNTEDDALVRNMFSRLNSFSMPLKPQELRNAMYQGPFLRLSEQLADDEYWSRNAIISAAAIRRMGDVEFVSDLLIGVMHGPQGGSAKVINTYYGNYEDCEDEFPDQRPTKDTFTRVLRVISGILPEIAETRWRNKNDFYSLFVSLADRMRTAEMKAAYFSAAAARLSALAVEVERRRANEDAKVSKRAVRYFDAVEKGANDKSRRGERHEALLEILDDDWFAPRKKKS